MRGSVANARFATALTRVDVSDALYGAVCSGADQGAFKSPAHAVLWFKALPAALQTEVVLSGVHRAIGNSRARAKIGKAGIRARRLVDTVKLRTHKEKSRLFDRVVEALDAHLVGDKRLGDCRRADLLRAAHSLETEAAEIVADAALYRSLAALIGDQTVRGYYDKGAVRALLTSRWAVEEAA